MYCCIFEGPLGPPRNSGESMVYRMAQTSAKIPVAMTAASRCEQAVD